jgi:hypothetical protein
MAAGSSHSEHPGPEDEFPFVSPSEHSSTFHAIIERTIVITWQHSGQGNDLLHMWMHGTHNVLNLEIAHWLT